MTRVARRLEGMEQSVIRAMTARCEAVNGINLGQGLCQVSPPASLLRHGADRFASVSHSYSHAQGDSDFLAALAVKLERDNGLDVRDPARQIITTIGATGAFVATLTALFDPGDGVVVLEPSYGYHLAAIRLLQLTPQPVRLAGPDFRLDCTALRAAITPGTRAVVVCTPANPSGRRFDCTELAEIAAVAVEHDLVVITDEIYEYIHYTPQAHLSPATVAGLADRTVTISGLSKSYSVPGWRLGYAAGPAELIAPVRIAADVLAVCAPTPLQQLAVHALTLPPSYYTQLREMYLGKLERLAGAFRAAGTAPNAPEGAYYLFVECGGLGVDDGWQASDLLLAEAGIATVPGEAFYLGDPGGAYVRACFSVPDELIDECERRLDKLAHR